MQSLCRQDLLLRCCVAAALALFLTVTFRNILSRTTSPELPVPSLLAANIDDVLSVDEKHNHLLNTLENRLKRFSGERRNYSSRRCDRLETPDTSIPCYEPACPGKFSASSRERLDQILARRSVFTAPYQTAMQAAAEKVTKHKYVFVTAVSSGYYPMLQALLKNVFVNVFPQLVDKDFLLVVFDIGLEKDQREMVEKHCRCTVLDFPFSQLPSFVGSLRCYTWKPLIIASMMDKADYTVWMDSSIRWERDVNFDVIFQRANERGFQVYANGGSMAVRTSKSMAGYFGDELCQYAQYDEFDANLAVFYNDRFTKEVIVTPWVACALNRMCMCVENHSRLLWCSTSLPRFYGRCHRFDQSALSILFTKLLLDQRPMVDLPPGLAKVKRGDALMWFP